MNSTHTAWAIDGTPLFVLHVKDNRYDALLLQRAAQKAEAPFVWHLVQTAEAAIAYLKAAGNNGDSEGALPDLVLLDLSLPGSSGFEVLKHLRSTLTQRNIPVIVLSGVMNPAVIDECAQLGAHSFVEKPFGFRELVEFARATYETWGIVQCAKREAIA